MDIRGAQNTRPGMTMAVVLGWVRDRRRTFQSVVIPRELVQCNRFSADRFPYNALQRECHTVLSSIKV